MIKETTALAAEQQRQLNTISPREMVIRFMPYLPWVIASVVLFLFLAFLKLRYQPNIYSVTGTLMVKDPSAMGANKDKMEEMLFSNPNKNINDEMQVIRSLNLGKRVVRALGLEFEYSNQGSVRASLLQPSESPFTLNILYLKDSATSFLININFKDEKQFTIGENGTLMTFNQPFENSAGRFSLSKNPVDFSQFASLQFNVSYAATDIRAAQLLAGLTATQSGESNNIMLLSYLNENPRLGASIINHWMKEYSQVGLEEKKLAAENALEFIKDQLRSVNVNLGDVERNLLGFREKNRIINPEMQAEQIISSLGELDKETTRQGVQLKLVDNLISYVSDNRTPYRQVGSILGIEEPSLQMQIGEFNKLQVERETMLKTTTRANPMIQSMETTIEKLRIDIVQNLKNVRQAFQMSYSNLLLQNKLAGQEISRMPAKEKELLDITRQQKILEQLSSFLLEKQLETSIVSASTISNVKVIEPALPVGVLVSPNRKGTFILAFLLGMALPALIVFLLEYLNDRVRGRYDVQRVTDAPIIGEISHSDEQTALVVSQTSRRFIAEQFRIIRTNLKYILPSEEKAVLLVTSSTSGEGKSFVSTNMGAVMALAGKKTAILEFDIRKPKIMSGLNMGKRLGATNYIIGGVSFEELPVPVPGFENLFVVPCGPIPPNPSELLLDERLDAFIKKLKESFDVIVIDTAPVGLVGDALVLGKYADACLYVVRHNYTFKKQLVMLDEIYANKRLPKVSLVLNDIDIQAGYGGYYGYGGYGYSGYGYGQGAEYFDEGKRKRKKGGGIFGFITEPIRKVIFVQKNSGRK